MVNVGIVGIGFMGMIHYLAYQRVGGAAVKAICTRNEKKLAGDWTGIQGNFGPPGEQMELGEIGRYKQLEELLADDSIDVVDVCLPPNLHADVAVKCLEAGKHVFVEKPMALTVAEADRMIQAAAKANRLCMVAHVLPFFPEFSHALNLIRTETYGRFRGGIFKRMISDPNWLKDFYDPTTVGGPVIDLHVHDAHFIRTVCGMPQSVFTRGTPHGEVMKFITTQFLFADPQLNVLAVSGVIDQQGRPFTHGFEIYLEQATLSFEMAVLQGQETGTGIPYTVIKPDGTTERPDLGSGDPVNAFVAQLTEMAQAIETNTPSSLLAANLARDALALCEAQTQSAKQGAMVECGG